MVITMGSGTPLRCSVMVMGLLGLPRISFTASSRRMSLVGVSPILMIRSPAFTPALAAGVPSMGETTFTKPSSVPISMPSPPNSPCVLTCSSLKAFSSR